MYENMKKTTLHHFFPILLSFCFFLIFWINSQAQTISNNGNVLLYHISYGYQIPKGDLAKRFGDNFNLGTGLEFQTDKGNWLIGLQGNFLFGQTVKEDVLANLRTVEGGIIANDRNFANIQLRQRAWSLSGKLGKVIPVSKENQRSGIKISLGLGLLQHAIKIQEDPVRTVPQLLGDYQKGYDRMSNGLMLEQFIGYQVLSKNQRINFYLGIEAIQAFTQNRRDFNFDTQTIIDTERKDLLYGVRLGWILPFYVGQKGDDIYY